MKDDKLNQEDEDDTAMMVGRFKGSCKEGGKFGHKAAQCHIVINTNNHRQNNNKENDKFNGKCFLCGKYGHSKADCWYNKSNPNNKINEIKNKNANNVSQIDEADEVS